MALLKRLDTVDIVVENLAQASATYQHNFGLTAEPGTDGVSASIPFAGVCLKLVVAAPPAVQGLAGLWLEAEDLEAVARALDAAGYGYQPLRRSGELRVLEVDRRHTSRVPLFIFDRSGDRQSSSRQ